MIELTDRDGKSVLVNLGLITTINTTDDYSTIYFMNEDTQEVIESVGEILVYLEGE